MADEYLQAEYHASAVGVDDLVLLSKVSNEAIVANLKARAAKGLIYTWVAPAMPLVAGF